MVIAAADVLAKQGFDIAQQLYVDATDVSATCFKMTYLHVAARNRNVADAQSRGHFDAD